MEQTFEYKVTTIADKQLDIQDIGNCCISGIDMLTKEYYLIIKTELGVTSIIEYGPTLPDFNVPPPHCNYIYDRFDYNEGKIAKRIEKFLNNAYYNIQDAQIVEIEEIKPYIQGFLRYLYE